MAQLVAQKVDLNGEVINYVAADPAGDKFANDGNTVMRVKNGSAAAITVTVSSPKPCSQGFNHNVAVNVAAGAEIAVGTFSPTRFNDQQGNVSVTYSAAASVTVAVVRQ